MKKLNSADPGVKRPIRVSDLQDIWDGLTQTLATGTSITPKILSGFAVDDSGNVGSGTVAYAGSLWFYDANSTPITAGASLYAVTDDGSGDTRLFGDGTTRPFGFNQTAQPAGSTLIGVFTAENIKKWSPRDLPVYPSGTYRRYCVYLSITAQWSGSGWTSASATVADAPAGAPLLAEDSPLGVLISPSVSAQTVGPTVTASLQVLMGAGTVRGGSAVFTPYGLFSQFDGVSLTQAQSGNLAVYFQVTGRDTVAKTYALSGTLVFEGLYINASET